MNATTDDLQELRTRGRCVGADPGLFTPENEKQVETVNRLYCSQCPVIALCLAFAADHNEYGIWGGRTRKQRKGFRMYRQALSSVL